MVQLPAVDLAKQFAITLARPVTPEHVESTYDTLHVTETFWAKRSRESFPLIDHVTFGSSILRLPISGVAVAFIGSDLDTSTTTVKLSSCSTRKLVGQVILRLAA